jgi:hypothetical protein
MRALAMRASRATVEPMQFAGLESRLLRGSRLVRKELRERCVSIALGQRPNTIVKAKARGVPPTRPPMLPTLTHALTDTHPPRAGQHGWRQGGTATQNHAPFATQHRLRRLLRARHGRRRRARLAARAVLQAVLCVRRAERASHAARVRATRRAALLGAQGQGRLVASDARPSLFRFRAGAQ